MESNLKQRSRKRQSLKNIIASLIYQMLVTVLGFVSRTIFIHTLGNAYLGINSLFTNILSVLSLTELGIGTAMTYSMYEPLANNDHEKLAALTTYFSKIYRVLAIIVTAIGLFLLPLLKYIVNLDVEIKYIHVYYLMYLADSVISYLCISKTAVITADQNDYIIKNIRSILNVIKLFLQVFVLLEFKSFIGYLVIQILISIFGNVVCARIAVKKYPFIRNEAPLDTVSKNKIWNNVRDMFSYKVGGVILNNTDQILISIIVGTVMVGLYSNYLMVITAVTGFTSAIFIAIQASVGNLSVTTDSQKQYEIFKSLDIISFWIYGFCSFCFIVLFQDFIVLWIGKQYLLSDTLVVIIVINYYITGVLYPIWCYRETVGLFKQTKNILFYTSIINIVLSVVLGKIIGLEGILIATVIARCATNVWFEPKKLYEVYFKRDVKEYYFEKIKQMILLVIMIGLSRMFLNVIPIYNLFIRIVVDVLLCIVVPLPIMYIYSRKKEEFKALTEMNIFKRMVNRKR